MVSIHRIKEIGIAPPTFPFLRRACVRRWLRWAIMAESIVRAPRVHLRAAARISVRTVVVSPFRFVVSPCVV